MNKQVLNKRLLATRNKKKITSMLTYHNKNETNRFVSRVFGLIILVINIAKVIKCVYKL
jgi:ABC-type sulfate/molybdate transport systems ATPase subunit